MSKVNLLSETLLKKVKELGKTCKSVLNNWQDSVVVEETDIETDLVDCDPAKRPEKLSDKQRHYSIRTGPHQHILASYPRNSDIPK